MIFSQKLLGKKIIVCAGPGGVGKTTVSVAIGFLAAALGRKTLVMTIDPAKRLADALNIQVGGEPSLVDPKLFSSHVWQPKAPLYAMMLDTKTAWQDLVLRLSPSQQASQPIFSNRFYRYLSEEIAGSQEFVACEALYTLANESDFDLIVLDTPPTAHALDFLEAPQRVLSFLDKEAFRLFLKYKSNPFSQLGFQFLKGSNGVAMGIIGKFVPVQFLQELTNFLRVFSDLYDPLVVRAQEFLKLLKSHETMFTVVTTPKKAVANESKELMAALKEKQFHVDAIILNQISFFDPELSVSAQDSKELDRLLTSLEVNTEERLHLEKIIEKANEEQRLQFEGESALLSVLQAENKTLHFLQLPRLSPGLDLNQILQALLPALTK